MTYRSTSSADFFGFEDREEMRFLRALKGVLRTQVAAVQDADGLTQEQIAERIGIAPAQLSRVLSSDRHNSTSTLFRVMHSLGQRWTFGSVPLPTNVGNRPVESSSQAQRAQVSGLTTSSDGTSAEFGHNVKQSITMEVV
jgi:transcriptional regulator with XRE-family HTH domain